MSRPLGVNFRITVKRNQLAAVQRVFAADRHGEEYAPEDASQVTDLILEILAATECSTRPKTPGICRRCGCTQERGCGFGCSWVQEDLCSACVAPSERKQKQPKGSRK